MSTDVVPSGIRPVPSWNSFFDDLFETSCKTVIAYGPMFPEPPTNPDVVEASLDYFINVTQHMEQRHTVVTSDQAIFDIVKGLQAKKPLKYADLIPRLGGFHIAENFMGAIGFFIKGSGFEDLLVDSKICGRGTANKVTSGKGYYQMIWVHSLVSEAIFRLKWNAFERFLIDESLTDTLTGLSDTMETFLCSLQQKDIKRESLGQVRNVMASLEETWAEFESTLGPTSRFWSMYLEMFYILQRYIRAERCGSWEDHLLEVRNMLPYIVSAGHSKYATCLPLYLADMEKLATTTPAVHGQFLLGNFSVHRREGTFNGVWSDMALEQTYNREGKTSLLKGVTQSAGTREKYLKTVPYLTSVSQDVKDMVHITQGETSHHGESASSNDDDETNILQIINTIETKMIDPFSHQYQDSLIHIATGEKLSTVDVTLAKEKGLEAMTIAEKSGSTKINPPKIETFATPKKGKVSSTKVINKIYKEEVSITRSLCFLQNSGEKQKREYFTYEWTEYPTSLFVPDSRFEDGYKMLKGNKADYFHSLVASLQSPVKYESVLPGADMQIVYIIDAMAFVNRFQTYGATTFGQLQSRYLKKILNMRPDDCRYVHFVGDRYDFPDDRSLKCDERVGRDQSALGSEYLPADNIDIPDWKLFLKNPKNKANLLHFLATSWSSNHSDLPCGVYLILGGTFYEHNKVIEVSQAGCTQIAELTCQEHEEADTRMFAHIAYSVEHYHCKRAVIQATDTDVIMISLYQVANMINLTEMWIETKDSFLPMHLLLSAFSEQVNKSDISTAHTLLCCYVLTGCDTVSFVFRRGKKEPATHAFKMVGKFPSIEQFGCPGDQMELSERLLDEARQFFVCLYGRKNFESLDLLRAHLFGPCRTDIRVLPPTENAFQFHVYRALYQLVLYKRAHLNDMGLPNPTNFGRMIVHGKLVPIKMTKPARPSSVRPVHCKCIKSKCLKSCSCAKASVPCIVTCICTGKFGKCGRVEDLEVLSGSDDDYA